MHVSVGRATVGRHVCLYAYVPSHRYVYVHTRQALAVCVGRQTDGGGMHLGRDVCNWGSEGGGDAPGGAHLGL